MSHYLPAIRAAQGVPHNFCFARITRPNRAPSEHSKLVFRAVESWINAAVVSNKKLPQGACTFKVAD
jgi:hypothetical protein